VPWLRQLITGLSTQRPRIVPGSVHVVFVVDWVALGQVFLRVLRSYLVNIIPPSLSIFILSVEEWTIRMLVAAVQRYIPPHSHEQLQTGTKMSVNCWLMMQFKSNCILPRTPWALKEHVLRLKPWLCSLWWWCIVQVNKYYLLHCIW
jgi:hypothetical protein